MTKHETINYLELPAKDIPATKAFFEEVFNWTFTDYGDEYTAFTEDRLIIFSVIILNQPKRK